MQGQDTDFTFNARFQRFGATIRAIEQSLTVTRVYRDVSLCAFCDQLLAKVKYIASNGKRVHARCYGRYEATITLLSASMEEIPMRFYLKHGEYILKCDGCPNEKKMRCNQDDIRRIAEADHWEQIGNRFLCPTCALDVRRKLYRATTFSR